MIVPTRLYLANKTKPVARVAADGVFGLTLLTCRTRDGRGRDAWLLRWSGPQAQAFWQQDGTDLVPGAELLADVDYTSLRPFSVGGRIGGAEIHAEVAAIVVTHVPGQRAAYAAAQCAIHCDFAAY